ncbi:MULTISPECIES: type I-B CRISPR-associated protein Cas7/Cst2/DevR [unclassified Crossiella]|uniref:type I-B CRISPR-associated protein Cas7/Cst2/DevR n=1 Tax=unclassified Crossiella TaxID=2620835 RepID=UPI001FFFECC8|nr:MULTISPECIES: type I-B CRISPR-associated protein Cas7/Cst2/DevR [unclassified Crossiella]MCK2245195.1 type I-B CRISPR-associated protein Cas7/Cst2/DevR [Crossiella sp. S99.2]MCK2258883.1 type I-B CRISPR-associated protein Cas7/Cst2/DevR [Crossiella sp. S99.1]
MTYLVGQMVLDIKAGAPNNGRGEANVALVKQIRLGRDIHPYIAAQATRYWLRTSLPPEERRSPVERSGAGAKQQAHTAGRPDLYLDDDLLGYMVAVKDTKKACQRDTVLATGTAVSVLPQRPTHDFGTMSRGFDGADPVIHEHEHYTAHLAQDMLLDLPRVGTFDLSGTIRLPDLAPGIQHEALVPEGQALQFRGNQSWQLPLAERRRRAAVLLETLAAMRGGAKQALHYGERSPALVLLAPMKGGNNPFTRIVRNLDNHTTFDTRVFREELTAWADELDGPIHIGWSPGFLGDQREKVTEQISDLIEDATVIIGHPRTVLRTLAQQLRDGERDDWFQDSAR